MSGPMATRLIRWGRLRSTLEETSTTGRPEAMFVEGKKSGVAWVRCLELKGKTKHVWRFWKYANKKYVWRVRKYANKKYEWV